jgi:hypothetical protein
MYENGYQDAATSATPGTSLGDRAVGCMGSEEFTLERSAIGPKTRHGCREKI